MLAHTLPMKQRQSTIANTIEVHKIQGLLNKRGKEGPGTEVAKDSLSDDRVIRKSNKLTRY